MRRLLLPEGCQYLRLALAMRLFISLSLLALAVSVNGYSYSIQSDFLSKWMNATVMTAELDMEIDVADDNSKMWLGQLRNIRMQRKPLESIAFAFPEQFDGEFMLRRGSTAEEIAIVRTLIDQISSSLPGVVPEGLAYFKTSMRNTTLGQCLVSYEKAENRLMRIVEAANCAKTPIYLDGLSAEEAKKMIASRILATETVYEDPTQMDKIKRIITLETINNNLGQIDIRTVIEVIRKHTFEPFQIGNLVKHDILGDDWRTEIVNDQFCEIATTLTEEIRAGIATDASEAPKTQVLEKFSMLIRNVRYAPVQNNLLRDCYLRMKESLPADANEVITAHLKVASSAFILAGTNESLKFLSHLMDNELDSVSPRDISKIPDNVPSTFLTPSYLRYYYKLVTKAMDSKASTDVKIAYIVSFSCILRKALMENVTSGVKLDAKLAYMSFFDVRQPEYSDIKENLAPIFIRAFANIPLEKSIPKFKQMLQQYGSHTTMQFFIVNSLDKMTQSFPEMTMRLLNEIYDEYSDESIRAMTFIQMMRTRLITTEQIRMISEQTTGATILKVTFQTQIAACLQNAYGIMMAEKCEEAGASIVDDKFGKASMPLNGEAIVDVVSGRRGGPSYAAIQSAGSDRNKIFNKFSISFVGNLPFAQSVVIIESGYSQMIFKDIQYSITQYLYENTEILVSKSGSASFPTSSGLPYIMSVSQPSMFMFKSSSISGTFTSLLSLRNQTKHGLMDSANKKELVLGIDSNIQIFLPKLHVRPTRDGFRIDLAEENFQVLKKDSRLLHASSWPYAVSRDIFYKVPTGNDFSVIHRRNEVRELPLLPEVEELMGIFPTGLAFDAKLKTDKSDESEFDIDCLSKHHVIANIWLNASKTTTKYIQVSFDVEKDLTNLQLMKKTTGNAFQKAGITYKSWGMRAGSVISLEFHGPPHIKYSLQGNYGQIHDRNALSAKAKLEIDSAQQYAICADLAGTKKSSSTVEIYGDVEYGMKCATGAKFSMDFSGDVDQIAESRAGEYDLSGLTVHHFNSSEIVLPIFCSIKAYNATIQPEVEC